MKYVNFTLLIILIGLSIFFNLFHSNIVLVDKPFFVDRDVAIPVPIPLRVEVPVPVPYRCLTDHSYVSPISASEGITILKEARDVHAYYVYIEPEDIAFHAMWVERYEQLIELIDSVSGGSQ